MSINNINNWFNFFAEKSRRDTKLKDEDLLAFGRRNRRFFNNYKPLAIRYGDLKKAFGSLADVEEAPIDSKQYARKDGDWAEVEGGLTPGSDIDVCNITMTPLGPNTLGTLEAFNFPGGPISTGPGDQIVGPLVVVPGVVEFSRSAWYFGAWYNAVQEPEGNYNTPADTEWNSVYTDAVLNGHGNIQDVADRTYGTLRDACNGQVGNFIKVTPLVCHVISTDQYFFFNVTSWDKGSQGPPYAGFVGDLQEVILDTGCEVTFSDGSKLNKAPINTNTWDIANAAFVDAENGNDNTGVIGDGNFDSCFASVQAALIASPTNFVIVKPGDYPFGANTVNNEVDVHIHCMAGVNFTGGGFRLSGSTIQKFRLTGEARFTGASCSVLELFQTSNAEIDVEFDYADNCALVVQNATNTSSIVRMNANWVLCNAFNGAGYAIRLWGNTEYHFNFKQYFHSQHTVAFARDGWTGKCIFTCPEIRVLDNYTSNYGNNQKHIFGMDSTNGAYLEVNGNQYNDHPTYAFSTVTGFYWESQLSAPTEVVMNGDIYVEAGMGVFGRFLSLYGDFTLNGNLTTNERSIFTPLTGWGGASDQRYTFNGSIIEADGNSVIGRGKYFYFKDCAIYIKNPTTNSDGFFAANGGSSLSYVYLYNSAIELTDPAAVTFASWNASFIIGAINTPSNRAIGAVAVDTWGGFSVIPTLEVPKKS